MDDIEVALESVCRNAIVLMRSTPGVATRVRVRSGDASVEVEWTAETGPPVPGRPAQPAEPATPADDGRTPPADLRYVGAPMVGTFYVAPAPGQPPFVSLGDVVEPGQQIGIIEAMKLMNPIEADQRGRVVEICVPDGGSVEYDQPLMALAAVDEEA